MKKSLKVAVIGVGHLGKEHARIYDSLPEAELIGICDTDTSKESKAKELGVPFFSNYRDLIGKVDAVSIVTPTASHYEIGKEFLLAGCHTLIEKPMTLKLEEADELIEIARQKNCALQVGHIERHNPGFKRIAQIAKNIRFFEIHRLGPFTGRINDCGVVLDLMIHDLDITLGLVQAEIENVDAVGINVFNNGPLNNSHSNCFLKKIKNALINFVKFCNFILFAVKRFDNMNPRQRFTNH